VFESDNQARPDLAALRELEALIRSLGDEMAGWRRRAQQAEARARELERAAQLSLEQMTVPEPAAPDQRAVGLERENADLRRRLDAARDRTLQMIERMRFLRQQQQTEENR
jgi:hypothetical protein